MYIRRKGTAYDAFCAAGLHSRAEASLPLPPLTPYKRCQCGGCRECRENAKWDRVFAKFEAKEPEVRGIFQCALNDL